MSSLSTHVQPVVGWMGNNQAPRFQHFIVQFAMYCILGLATYCMGVACWSCFSSASSFSSPASSYPCRCQWLHRSRSCSGSCTYHADGAPLAIMSWQVCFPIFITAMNIRCTVLLHGWSTTWLHCKSSKVFLACLSIYFALPFLVPLCTSPDKPCCTSLGVLEIINY